MNLLYAILYSGLFSLAYCWAVLAIIERKAGKYREGAVSMGDSLLIGFFFLGIVYLTNLVVMVKMPDYALFYDLALLGGLLAYFLYKETGYRREEAGKAKELRMEMRVLEHHAANDPANAVLYERASEIFEKLGEKENAVAAARHAVKLEPSVRNMMRLKELEEELLGGKGGGEGA